MLNDATPMDEAVHFITLFPYLRHVVANSLDRAGIVTTYEGPGVRAVIDVLPVSGIDGYGDGLDEDIPITELRKGTIGDEFCFARALNDDGFLGSWEGRG